MKKKNDNTISIGYKSIGKKTTPLKELIEIIPKQFRATNKTSSIFTTIIVIVIGIGVFNAILPIMDVSFDITSEETEAFKLEINVGIPLQFFGNQADEDTKIKMNATNLIIDLLLYLLVAYMLDVLLNFLLSLKLTQSKAELKRKPKEVKLQTQSLSTKATENVVEKVAKKIIKNKPVQPIATTKTQTTTKQKTIPAQNPTTKQKNPKVKPVPEP
jgi:hypothetical protein